MLGSVRHTGWLIWSDSWVGLTLILDVPSSCPLAQPVLPISYQPKQNQAEGGKAQIKVNPTQISDQMDHPVCILGGDNTNFTALTMANGLFSVLVISCTASDSTSAPPSVFAGEVIAWPLLTVTRDMAQGGRLSSQLSFFLQVTS